MGRGQHRKTQLKHEANLIKTRLKAELEFKKTKQGLEKSARDHLGKLIDRIDPFQTVAILGTTYLVHEVITKTPGMAIKTGTTAIQWYFSTWGVDILGWLNTILPPREKPIEKDQPIPNDILLWVVSFAIGYIIVLHAGSLIGLLGDSAKSLTSLVSFLLPAAAAAV